MGLLDEAIREHLELKRLRGADPGEVAREEHEAFGAAATLGVVLEQKEPDLADAGSDTNEVPESVGQETVELDMAAILHADADTVSSE